MKSIKVFILLFLFNVSLRFGDFGLSFKINKNESIKEKKRTEKNDKDSKSLFVFNKKFINMKSPAETQNGNLDKSSQMFKFKSTSNLDLENTKQNLDSLVHQGWLKYIEITDDLRDVPSTFTKNKMFYLQMSENPGINTLAKDNVGYINLPNEDMFFFNLSESANKLNIFTARNPPYKKLQKSLNLDDLINQESSSPCKGGIEEVGNFSEGYCFMLKFQNFNRHYIWELCSESIYEKDKWMNILIQINNKKSHKLGKSYNDNTIGNNYGNSYNSNGNNNSNNLPIPVLTSIAPGIVQPIPPGNFIAPGLPVVTTMPVGYQLVGQWTPCSKPCGKGVQTISLDCIDINVCKGRKLMEKLCNIEACKEDVDKHLNKLKKVADGQWEYLGSWSDCSRPCGGGVQVINRRCLSGTCVGETFIKQNCNTFVCAVDPNNMVISADIFNREQYDECKLLEGNLMMVINNHKVLSHVEVNMQTVHIFSKDNPNMPIIMPLSKLSAIRPSASSPDCFKLIGDSSAISLCPQAPEVTPIEVWVKRIQEFKTECSNKILKKMQSEITQSLELSKDPNANSNRFNLIQSKVLEDEKIRRSIKEHTLENQFEEFKRQTRELLAKEDAYETNLEKEERERIEWEDHKMKENAAQEQAMANKLITDLQTMSSADNSYTIKERAIKREMKDLMNEVQMKISQKREKLINNIQRMKTLHEISEKKTAKELMDMKREMGKKLYSMNKQGNPNQCFIRNVAMINNYCTSNYPDFDMQIECKKPKQFCYMCCDNEIGQLNKEYLNCCYNKCDDLNNSQCFTFNEAYHIVTQQVAFLS